MPDPRTHPGIVTQETAAQVTVPVADLLRAPGGARDRQLLLGEAITILHHVDGHALVRAERDGYHGYLPHDACGAAQTPSHKLAARSSHLYTAADLKSPERAAISFGCLLTATGETPEFIETAGGFVPRQHVQRAETRATDPAGVAALFVGAPYLWGGNSAFGIDCSGLVQAACLACGLACPGDSDQQARSLGTPLPDSAALERNDLIFWKGHVALVTGPDAIIHANAGHMAVACEGLQEAIDRIGRQGGGRPTAYRRLPPV